MCLRPILGGGNVFDGYILPVITQFVSLLHRPCRSYFTHSDFRIVGFRVPIFMIDSIVWGSEDSLYCTPSSREQEAELIRR